MAGCPPRPASDRPQDTGFTRQPMTQWLAPGQLAKTGLRVLLSGIFGTYADKREYQEVRPAGHYDCSERSDLWFDFVSDIGDGFNPTYALASILAEEKLDLAGPAGVGENHPTQRGSLLVMGGDEVYPTADIDSYKNKTVGPYRAALPYTASDHPRLFALPGNHDWYDGLTSFSRVFCQGNWIGGWQTSQRRSYFAAALPHRWWLWGIDIQFDTYIDEPQLQFFRDEMGSLLQPGDSVILCSAMPNWVYANEGRARAHAYDTLDFFQRTAIEPTGAVVRANLTGDAHHYARYQETAGDAQMFTAGGGGAFLSATHHLPEILVLPPPDSPHTGTRSKVASLFDLKAAYPTKAESKAIARGIVNLPRKNPTFVALMSAVYLLFAWTIQSALVRPGQRLSDVMHSLSVTGVAAGIAHSPEAVVAIALLVLGMSGFTKTVPPKKYVLGSLHALAHLVAVVLLVRLVDQVLTGVSGLPYLAGYLVLVGAAGGLLGSLVMAGYLYVAGWYRCNDNELFAAQRIEDWKNFLRLHIDTDGVLTVYPVKVDRVPKKWRLRQGGKIDDPWFEPDGTPPRPVLIEAPIRIRPASDVA